MNKFTFKNNADRYSNYQRLDTNPSHYQSRRDNYSEGVSITYIDGSYFRTKDLTVDDVKTALHDEKKRWLELPNGGEINLGYVIHYEPYKFFENNYRNNKRGFSYDY